MAQLDPARSGASQLTYATYLGTYLGNYAEGVSVDAADIITLAGWTPSHTQTSLFHDIGRVPDDHRWRCERHVPHPRSHQER